MSKRSSRDSRSLIAGIIGAIIIAIASYLGLDLSGTIDDEPVNDSPPGDVAPPPTSGDVQVLQVGQGVGASARFWEVYFTAPTGSTDPATYNDGIDAPLANAIDNVQSTLDIAAFEWNNPTIHAAVLRAHQRGVQVRMAVDSEHTHLDEAESEIRALQNAGVPIAPDDRSGLMHNKFMIMDGQTVWTGSTNFTVNGVYRNNNNLLMLRSRRAVEAFQAEFDEMFTGREFGSSRSEVNSAYFNQDGVEVQVVFSPEDDVLNNMRQVISLAEESVRFMTFSFTLDEIGEVLLEEAQEGIDIQGIFEVRGSETEFSEMPRLLCAGLDVRQDGNSFTFHHKVFIIDDEIVMTGSFNISNNATERNDENQVIISDPDLAAQYIAEFERRWAEARVPDGIECD